MRELKAAGWVIFTLLAKTTGVSAEKEDGEVKSNWVVGFSSIICIDQPFSGNVSTDHLVYYRGPLGEIEFAVLLEDPDFTQTFLKRWRSYLLSLEKV